MQQTSLDIQLPLDARAAAALLRRSLAADVQLPQPQASGIARLYAAETFDPQIEPCVVSIGAFDGVHRGHQALIARAIADAHARGARALVATFDPDPGDVLAPDVPARRLLSIPDRVRFLLAQGVDGVLTFPFTQELRRTSYGDFVLKVLGGACQLAAIHVGSDFRMGDDRASGDVAAIAEVGQAHGIAVHGLDLVSQDGAPLSATRIRGLLQQGELAEANALLGRCHFMRGEVIHGRAEGRNFGFPTANVTFNLADCLPQDGVYGCYVVVEGRAWPAAVNVGAPPSFSEKRPAFLEANLIGFEGDLYGEQVCVVFVSYLRPSRAFDSLDELIATVKGNIATVAYDLGAGEVDL